MPSRAALLALAVALCGPVAGFAAPIVNAALPITHQVSVQIIETAPAPGAPPATIFGNASQRASIEAGIDSIWAQAGIDIAFLPSITRYNDSFAYQGTISPRPNSDLGRIITNATTAGVMNTDPRVINMFFVNVVPGFAFTSENSANGIANIANDGIAQFVGDALLTFPGGWDVIASVVAHEIGHNLGLDHTPSGLANLMSPQADSAQLTPTQVASALTRTSFPRLLPLRVAGDYNGDGTVDAADYAVWRNTLGSRTALAADGNANLVVDAGDYSVWRGHFGQRGIMASQASLPATQLYSVPEPDTVVILAAAAVGLVTIGITRARPRKPQPVRTA